MGLFMKYTKTILKIFSNTSVRTIPWEIASEDEKTTLFIKFPAQHQVFHSEAEYNLNIYNSNL